MKLRKQIISILVFCLLAGILAVVLAVKNGNQTDFPSSIAGEVPAGSLCSTKTDRLPEGSQTVLMNGLVEPYDMETLSEKSTLVVCGTVSYIHAPILVKSSEGAVSVHTDVEILPEQVFRGDASEKIVLRLPGGLFDGKYYDYSDVPELRLNEKYLFFLFRSAKGFGIYTEGGQYYLRGLSQGVFHLASNETESLFVNSAAQLQKGAGISEDLQAAPAGEAVFTAEKLKLFCDMLNRTHPYDETDVAEERLKTYEENWRGGVITRKAYEKDVADQDNYAVELTLDEWKELKRNSEAEKNELRRHLSETGK